MKKKIKFRYVCLSLFSLTLIFLSAENVKAQPKIAFNENEFDLGEMYQNSQKKHVFEFKNTGTQTLTIEQVKGG